MEGNTTWGVDGDTGSIVDMKDFGIWEPLSVKIQIYKTAIEVRGMVCCCCYWGGGGGGGAWDVAAAAAIGGGGWDVAAAAIGGGGGMGCCCYSGLPATEVGGGVTCYLYLFTTELFWLVDCHPLVED